MPARSLADLSLSFGLVSIPVKLFSATQSKDGVSFNLLHRQCGSRMRQQYVCIREDVVVPREDMVKGYQFSKDQYVIFEPEELKALEEKGTHSIDIVAFVPAGSIDPIYYDKAYYLAPDKRGDRPYSLLLEGMKQTGRVALARWAWRGKSYTVQVRPSPEGGLVLQQLLYADEVRSMNELDIPDTEVKKPELALAVQLIDQIARDSFDPREYEDEVKKRMEAAVEQKVAGQEISISDEPEAEGGKVIDLMAALKASLAKKSGGGTSAAGATATEPKAKKSARRATPREETAAPAEPKKATGTHGAAKPAAKKTRAKK
ncbi:MAG: end-binding protein Ku [Herminiimonas sp.]|nr:end-binding protein Ku [Herminiimonas sp.]